ncbi:hypothetical protein DD509_03160 [Dehalogenimonas alkenigignens]|uniref:Uncharacterized protein n=1 Tax=Dehalogenimonas alkenigignens TaxID=1217799 RepID=A0A0W0GHM3_9CHLR|nr:hypothetical protein DEALK_09000 [Dehalogenimonas alkenigignens]PVV84308.1 hypothetical protein DD509_03160 [Dehalogenimonas alkenigignens]
MADNATAGSLKSRGWRNTPTKKVTLIKKNDRAKGKPIAINTTDVMRLEVAINTYPTADKLLEYFILLSLTTGLLNFHCRVNAQCIVH